MHPRAEVPSPLARALETLLHDFGEGARQASGESIRPREIPGDGPTGLRRSARGREPAHRHRGAVGVASEEVRHGDAVVGEKASSVAGARLDESGVGRPVGDEHPAQLTVVPAEGGDPVEGAVQDAELAGGRRARELRGPLLEAMRAVSEPAGDRRQQAGLKGPSHHR